MSNENPYTTLVTHQIHLESSILGTSASLSSFDDDLFGTNDDFDYQQNEASFDELVERYDKMYSGNDITEPSITDNDANANGTRAGAGEVLITANLTSIVDDLAEILSNEGEFNQINILSGDLSNFS